MTRNEKILRDLTQHMRDKVAQNVVDYMDRCKTVNLPYRDAATDLLMFFSQMAAGYAACQFDVEEVEFIRLMQMQFRRAKNQLKEDATNG